MLRFILVNDRTPRASLRFVLCRNRRKLRSRDRHEFLLLQPRLFRRSCEIGPACHRISRQGGVVNRGYGRPPLAVFAHRLHGAKKKSEPVAA
jgi:hypothetical protein